AVDWRGRPVEGGRALQDAGVTGKTPLPEAMTHDRHARVATRAVFLREEVAAKGRCRAEDWQKVRGDRVAADDLCVLTRRQRVAHARDRGQPLERRRTGSPVEEVRMRSREVRPRAVGVAL